jgi:hypothetical protein
MTAHDGLFGEPDPAHVVAMPKARAKRLILRHLNACADRGATCEEIEDATKLLHQSASSALRSLVQIGAVEYTGLRRENKSGYRARIWRTVRLSAIRLKGQQTTQ